MDQRFDYDVFLSHSSKDKDVVRKLARQLENDNLRVWFDETSITIGGHIGVALEKGLQTSHCVALMMSPHAFESDWVTAERWSILFPDPLNKDGRFIPVLLADCNIPLSLKSYKYVDYRNPSEDTYQQLLNVCKPQHRPTTPRLAKGPDGRYELAVHLSVQGNQLHRAFYNHQRTFLDESDSPWQPLENMLSAWRTHPVLCKDHSTFTDTLWEALCGTDDTKILAILKQLTDADLQTPIYEAFRVRIHTQDAFLAELPWALTTWQGQSLIKQEWTFEFTATHPADNARHYNVDLPSPFPVLLLAPASDTTTLDWDMHHRDVEQKFLDLWRAPGGSVHTANTRQISPHGISKTLP